MNASLMMYNFPSLRGAHGRYWALIRDHLRAAGHAAPDTLADAPTSIAYWTIPEMVLSQTCGLPYRNSLHQKLQKVGTPDYGLPGCPPGYYCSHLIKRRSDQRSELKDFDSARAGINEYTSQSGFVALSNAATAVGITFSDITITGAHRASLNALREDRIDIAAVDAVTWHLLCRDEDADRDLVSIGQSDPTPGLPYVCSLDVDRNAVHAAVKHAIVALDQVDRDTLMLRGLVDIPKEDYLAIPTPAQESLTVRP